METEKFLVPSITCNVCSDKIVKGLMTLDGVQNVSVDVASKQVQVDYDPSSIQSGSIKKAVAGLGFEVT